MAYERVNWENSPSRNTPLNEGNLNTMDAGIAALDAALTQTNALITQLQSLIDLLQARMDTFVALEDGSTTGDAELIDARTIGDGITYASLGDAMRALYDYATTDETIIMDANDG